MTKIPVRFDAIQPSQDIRPTDEQAAIIGAARTGEDLVVIAGAGSGKTSTQRMVGKALNPRRGFYIAYNKAIAEDAKGTFPPNVNCSTAHSLGFRAVGFHYQHRLTDARVPAWRVAEILGIRHIQVDADEEKNSNGEMVQFPPTPIMPKHLAIIAADTLRTFCWSADVIITQKHVPWEAKLSRRQAQQVADAVVPYAKKIWDDVNLRDGGRMRFEHDHYLKMWQLEGKQMPADFILLDEAQDANPVIAAIVNQQHNAQKILVGDPAQQIYAWRGAVDAMKGFPGARLPLSKSFRFGPAIAEQANAFLELLGDFRITGNEKIDSVVGPVDSPRAILCRTNAEALAQVVAGQQIGQRVAMVGGGRELIALARAAIQLQHNMPTEHRELMLFRSWSEVEEFVQSESAGSDLKVFVHLINTYTAERLIQVVDDLYPEVDANLIISTSHKAKGREWDSVRVAPDFAMRAEQTEDSFSDGEIRLAYVTVTRAKLQLDPGGLDWINN